MGRQEGNPKFHDSLSSRSIMSLYLCTVSVPCMCLPLRGCLRALCHEPSQGYLRCWRVSASACFSLPQGASICRYDGAAVVVLMPFSSSFYPWILSLQRQIEEVTYIATCLRSLAFLNCFFHYDIYETKILKPPGWCTHTHARILYTDTSKHCPPHPPSAVGTPSSLSLVPLMFLFLRHPQPHRGFSCPSLGPISLLYKKTLEHFSCCLLNS